MCECVIDNEIMTRSFPVGRYGLNKKQNDQYYRMEHVHVVINHSFWFVSIFETLMPLTLTFSVYFLSLKRPLFNSLRGLVLSYNSMNSFFGNSHITFIPIIRSYFK